MAAGTAVVAVLSMAAASMAMTVAQAESVSPDSRQEVCAELTTGHQPGDGDNSYTVTAPAGKLIVRTCVKAGSDQSVPDGAVEYATYSPGVASVTIYGPGGKDISHWSAEFATAPVYTGEKTVSGSEQICTSEDQTVTVSFTSGLVTRTSTESQEAADAAAQAAAEAAAAADRASKLAAYPDFTPGACPTEPTVYTGEATVSGSEQICTAQGATVTVSFTSGLVTRTSTESQAAADAAAQAAASAGAAADRASRLAAYPGFAAGACVPANPPSSPPASPTTVVPVTVEEPVTPEPVAVPLPATVDEPEQPVAVAVPMPATAKVPSSVPAGDGSTAPQAPRAALALLLVSLVGLGAAATTLMVRRQE